MRLIPLITACSMLSGPALAQTASPLQHCVPQREMQEVVAAKQVVAPAFAMSAARRQVPNADVVRASLCRSDNALVYVIVALRRDGRVVQVMIDAPSGRVKSVQ